MHFVKKAKYLGDYKLRLTFEKGTVKIIDLKRHLKGEIFKPLVDKEYFKKVRVNRDLETIVWSNGADISPDFLYKIGISEKSRQSKAV